MADGDSNSLSQLNPPELDLYQYLPPSGVAEGYKGEHDVWLTSHAILPTSESPHGGLNVSNSMKRTGECVD